MSQKSSIPQAVKSVSQVLIPDKRRLASYQVFGHGRLRYIEPKHQQLAVDPRCAPQWVLVAHPLDQVTQSLIDL